MPKMTFDNFRIKATEHGSGCAQWESGDRRFHVWFDKETLALGDTLHSNPITSTKGRSEHKGLNLKAKKHAQTLAFLAGTITADKVRDALEVDKANEAAKEEAVLAAREKAMRDGLRAAKPAFGVGSYADLVDEIAEHFSRDLLFALEKALRQ